MPGMMDTVLNLGLNDTVVEGLAAKADARFAYDAYRRFLDMFGNVVMGVSHALFEDQLEAMKVNRFDGCWWVYPVGTVRVLGRIHCCVVVSTRYEWNLGALVCASECNMEC